LAAIIPALPATVAEVGRFDVDIVPVAAGCVAIG